MAILHKGKLMFADLLAATVSAMQGCTYLLSSLPIAYTDVSHERLRAQFLIARLLPVRILVHRHHVRVCGKVSGLWPAEECVM